MDSPKLCTVSYRFSFNGQEKVDEISGNGNHNTALFWEYDTRLGRRWNIDPVVKPWESSYATLADNPIYKKDPSGNVATEYKQVVNEDGTSTKTKVSDLGGDKVDFTHIEGGAHDGQTRIESKATGKEVYMKSSKDIEGFSQREKGVNWNTIYEEFLSGKGPENSLITTPGMLQEM